MPLNTTIAGVGPGLGAALARKFSQDGNRVAVIARSQKYLPKLVGELRADGREVLGLSADVTRPRDVKRAFERTRQELGRVDCLVYNASETAWKSALKLSAQEFEHAWRSCVFGAFLCVREAARQMVRRRTGTILFTGATSSVRGRGGAAGFSSAKFALRGLADSLARELWPRGIHVAHVVIDGMIDTPKVRRKYRPKANEPLLLPEDIAETYWQLTLQAPSAWTWELDLRPHREDFFA